MNSILIILCCSVLALTNAATTGVRSAIPFEDLEQPFGTSSRIVGGQAASADQFPWQARFTINTFGASLTCGGSIISNEWILTAAHCVDGYLPFALEIYLGSHIFSSPLITTTSTAIHVHPDYNPSNFNNDIALVQLVSPVPISSSVKPILLPTIWQANTSFVNANVTASGFGRTSPSNPNSPALLQYVNLRVMSHSNCLAAAGENYVISSSLCAKGHTNNAAGPCSGDSGGPLAYFVNGVPTLIGITSYRVGECINNYPSVYTRTASFLNWINSVSGIPLRI